MKDYVELKKMKQADKAKAFDILIDEYIKSCEDVQGDFSGAFVNTLDWCVKWFGKGE